MSVTRLNDPSFRHRRRAADKRVSGPPAVVGTVAGDRQLVRAAALGDAESWDRIVDGYAQLVWDVAREAGLARRPATDVSALVWLRLAQSLPDLDGEPLERWLIRVAGVESRDALARIRRRSREPWDGVERRAEQRESG